MNSKPLPTNTDFVDEARHQLCGQFASALRGGAVRVRVRLPAQSDEAWVYEHRDNIWHKRETALRGAQLIQAVNEQLALLASKPHGDAVQVTQHTASDWQEVDIVFRRAAIEQHLEKNLESYLVGLLFLDRHDSKKDVRRHVQTGPRRPGRGH